LIGGGERYALELSRAMAERVPTTLVSFDSAPRVEQAGRLEIRVLRNWLPFRRFAVDPLNPALLSQLAHADIIHYHQTRTMLSSLALLYAHTRGIPIYGTSLGGGGLALPSPSDWYAGHLHISEFSRRVSGHAGLPNARVILGGVDSRKFSPGQSNDPRRGVLFVGRLLPHKGINYLIEAVDTEISLTIAGRRWWRRHDRFYALLQRLACGKHVVFQEDWDDDQVIAAYRQAACVVLPSVYTTVFGERYRVPELLGQTLLEGMACGAPAICTEVGGMPEVVEDGVTGFIVPPNDPVALGDRIGWLRDHPAEAHAMGREARRRVLERFSWDAVVDRCLEAYGIEAPAPPSVS
jgi:glycosyltransferase involved in cell wall biosynthesis